jgi:hypothetical protein
MCYISQMLYFSGYISPVIFLRLYFSGFIFIHQEIPIRMWQKMSEMSQKLSEMSQKMSERKELILWKLPIKVMILAYKDTEIQHIVILKVLNLTTISSQNKVNWLISGLDNSRDQRFEKLTSWTIHFRCVNSTTDARYSTSYAVYFITNDPVNYRNHWKQSNYLLTHSQVKAWSQTQGKISHKKWVHSNGTW